ncbi:MAG: DUF6786 family protein [Bacteroidales bacterium]
MKTSTGSFTLLAALLAFCASGCHDSGSSKNQSNMDSINLRQGSYGYDLRFLQEHGIKTIELTDSGSEAKIMVAPCWQGRVLTSSASGLSGHSFGWINYGLISSGKPAEHINAFGGEERIWLGPEGGPFSLYFKPGTLQEYTNWFVPEELDTEAFQVKNATGNSIELTRSFELTNYSGSLFKLRIDREIKLLDAGETASSLGMDVPPEIKAVAYRSVNSLTNEGSAEWNKKTGMPSIWMLSMMVCSPEVTVFIPFRKGNDQEAGPVVSDDYFGKVPSDRLKISDGMIWFRADGKHRSKIGLSQARATAWSGSYDADSKSLTLLWCALPESQAEYVNSKWGAQDNPFRGDALNSYNDGPLEDGSQMGPFYELETSSPAAALSSGKTLQHEQRIFHLEGDEASLSRITEKLFGITITEIKSVF